ncbi:S-adenosylmethionine decarboxylase proenzyme [Melipona quadrifasciata]|uniref:S-adenosylmethionine decarboxylase proenzyme n=1 Tax=Melipona quadrifasciata TaxID=166423 RepID=A0A0M8ZRC1_9HYME|nr:S-adenosylmethionine decarboxylase proenzyme [Melipona quadrifasciata]
MDMQMISTIEIHVLCTCQGWKWQSLLKIVRCEIISICHTEHVDAYVLSGLIIDNIAESKKSSCKRMLSQFLIADFLNACMWPLCYEDNVDYCFSRAYFVSLNLHLIPSRSETKNKITVEANESSMFLSKRRLILKTCGTTTPLQCLEPLLELVKEYTGFEEVEPELQISPHQAFEEEVALLDTFFSGGEAYCLGSVDSDCWYLYTLNKEKPVDEPSEPDQTLEILMTHLDPEVMALFTRDVCSSADEATQKSGIDKLIPNMIIDDFLFEPCGYSMNGVSKNGNYMTIHITPELEFSYVSFESNIPETSYEEIIRRVLNTFKPKKFVVTIFANKESIAASCPRDLEQTRDWLRTDVQYCRFKNYDLTCAFYSRFPS